MIYEIKDAAQGCTISRHTTERAAIERAAKLDNAVVISHETSGTYQSWTQVWPTRGETYTN